MYLYNHLTVVVLLLTLRRGIKISASYFEYKYTNTFMYSGDQHNDVIIASWYIYLRRRNKIQT